MRVVMVAVLAVLATGCASRGTRVQYFPPANPQGPFSKAVRVGDILFLSGEIGSDSTGRLAPGGIEGETRQTLENIKATLASHGLGMEHVVKCTAMLADIAEWPRMNRVYVTYFPGTNKPARSAFAGSGLALGARMELECWAVFPKGS